MAYYDALIAAWNSATQPPTGVTGTALNAGMNTATKVATINQWKMNAPAQPMILPTYRLYNCIVAADWTALTDIQRQNVRDILTLGTTDASVNTATRNVLMATFPGGTPTRTNLTALTTEFDAKQSDWCFVNAYPTRGQAGPGNLSTSDAANAGLV